MPTVCLVMIVKNEAAVIARCLRSAKPLIDYWIVCDTGSSDGTQALIRRTLGDLPGKLFEDTWENFSHNRNLALGRAREKADYLLLLDADMEVEANPEVKEGLSADAYLLPYDGPVLYYQPLLVSSRHDWRYRGLTHEYLDTPVPYESEKLDSLRILHHADGGSRSDKLQRDEALLLQELEEHPGNPRSMFYLAMTYEALGHLDQAHHWHHQRVAAGGWNEEVWYSMFRIARLEEKAEEPWSKALAAYMSAYQYRPTRAEPLYQIARHYRENGEYEPGYLFARAAAEIPLPDDTLFIDRATYDHLAKLEQAVCDHWSGRLEEAVAVNNELLDNPALPPKYRLATIRNQELSVAALYADPNAVEKSSRVAPALARRNRIKVVVPFHNPGHYLDNCVESLLAQDYDGFDMIFIDDGSTDDSALSVPVDDPRVTLVRNPCRRGGGYNLHHAFTEHCEPDDIVVQLDGDDWLAVDDALSHIDRRYEQFDCWVLYGQFRYVDGSYGISRPFPNPRTFEEVRSVWYSSAVRTFRAGLYHRIVEQDPSYRCMKDAGGQFYTAAMDMAFMYPIMELAGFSRVRYCSRVLYVYNTDNPLCVHKRRRPEEASNAWQISRKPRFSQVETYRPQPPCHSVTQAPGALGGCHA